MDPERPASMTLKRGEGWFYVVFGLFALLLPLTIFIDGMPLYGVPLGPCELMLFYFLFILVILNSIYWMGVGGPSRKVELDPEGLRYYRNFLLKERFRWDEVKEMDRHGEDVETVDFQLVDGRKVTFTQDRELGPDQLEELHRFAQHRLGPQGSSVSR